MKTLEKILFWPVALGTGVLVLVLLFSAFGISEPPMLGFGEAVAMPAPSPAISDSAAIAPFTLVTRVLQSPRCMNCHPVGDRPLRGGGDGFHAMNIGRRSLKNGLTCSTCHTSQNSEFVGVAGGPPGAPHWGLPPKETPMVFEGRSERELCMQLNDRKATGDRDIAALLRHVREDPLVLWGWSPGGDRKPPPYSHDQFVTAFESWLVSGASCKGLN